MTDNNLFTLERWIGIDFQYIQSVKNKKIMVNELYEEESIDKWDECVKKNKKLQTL